MYERRKTPRPDDGIGIQGTRGSISKNVVVPL